MPDIYNFGGMCCGDNNNNMMLNYCAFTNRGINRYTNDDRIFINNNLLSEGIYSSGIAGSLLCVICDGVGSAFYGAQAADIIAKSFMSYNSYESSPNVILKHMLQVNKYIVEEQSLLKNEYSMISTIAGLSIAEGRYLAFNLGDTRIYAMTSDQLSLISFDHTVRNENNFLFLSKYGNKDALTRYMGGDGKTCFPFFKRGTIKENCKFLICSDGLYKFVSQKDIMCVLNLDCSINGRVAKLYQLAVDGGSPDDISIALIDCLS